MNRVHDLGYSEKNSLIDIGIYDICLATLNIIHSTPQFVISARSMRPKMKFTYFDASCSTREALPVSENKSLSLY